MKTPIVAIVADRVILVALSRRLALEVLLLDSGPVAFLLEDGRVCHPMSLGRA